MGLLARRELSSDCSKELGGKILFLLKERVVGPLCWLHLAQTLPPGIGVARLPILPHLTTA